MSQQPPSQKSKKDRGPKLKASVPIDIKRTSGLRVHDPSSLPHDVGMAVPSTSSEDSRSKAKHVPAESTRSWSSLAGPSRAPPQPEAAESAGHQLVVTVDVEPIRFRPFKKDATTARPSVPPKPDRPTSLKFGPPPERRVLEDVVEDVCAPQLPYGHQDPALPHWERFKKCVRKSVRCICKNAGGRFIEVTNIDLLHAVSEAERREAEIRKSLQRMFVIEPELNAGFDQRVYQAIGREFTVSILDEIGKGRYGFVMEALGPPPDDIKLGCIKISEPHVETQSYAIKILPFRNHSYRFKEYWKKHAEIEAYWGHHLNHPNIIRFIDYSAMKLVPANPSSNNDVERHFYAYRYELMDTSLDRMVDEVLLAPREMARLACQIGSALIYMHNRHVVHHDVKPGNIVAGPYRFAENLDQLEEYDLFMRHIQRRAHYMKRITYKLIDFATVREYFQPPQTMVGVSFHRAGTFYFMCPEKRNKGVLYNPYKADSYAFGLTLMLILQKYDTDLCKERYNPYTYLDAYVDKRIAKARKAHATEDEIKLLQAIRRLVDRDEQKRALVADVIDVFEKFDKRHNPRAVLETAL